MPKGQDNPLSDIPAVEKVLHALENGDALPPLPRPLITELVRGEIAALRDQIRDGETPIADFNSIVASIRARLCSLHRSRIHSVINGTGVIIHTNLGRSPLSKATADAIRDSAMSYSNIELDLDTGERGKRGAYLERCLALLCKAEAATVVNNCAAALVIILKHLANGERNEVIISRGELVEIGGGFRIPEILEVSGATLREVGATNKTSIDDYAKAVGPRTGMILKVHQSNFYQEGFVGSPSTEELVSLGKEHGIPVVEDLGSGAMLPTESLAPIPHEPTAVEVLTRGVDLVCVSGDKLLGGTQAGIIAGRADLVAGLKKEPFFRAMRCDKTILAGLQEVVTAYLGRNGDETPDLPLTEMLTARVDQDLRPRAEQILAQVNHPAVSIGESIARCGGGTMPKAEIPSLALDIRPENISLKKLASRLREGHPPIMGYTTDDCLRIDLRTVFPHQDEALVKNILAIL
jgi:L-seryl-tRNA(Ser) seleniumtransferase